MLLRALLIATLLPALAAAAPPAEARYSLDVNHQDVKVVLREFARRAGISLSYLDEVPSQLITVEFRDLPFAKALRQILMAGNLDYRLADDVYTVGLTVDLKLRFPESGEETLDATYRCRRVGAQSLADAIHHVLPRVKITTGPMFLSPVLDNGTTAGEGDDEQLRFLGGTDVSNRTHDVVISGPAAMVRRALELARKFDRPRSQVRINIKVVTMNANAAQDLGVSWMGNLALSATENSDPSAPTSGSTGAALVDGIRLGRFSHSALTVNATLNALEQKGRSKVLSNPTIMLLDGERSFILNGSRYLYPRFTGKDQGGQYTYDVAETKIGVYLQVGVQIGLDNDMVLTLYPQVTSIGSTRTINQAEYPTINSSEEQTTVRAVSGEVIVLGGMLQDSKSTSRGGFPFLSRIPLIGRLFGSDSDRKVKQELMIILTPELVEETLPETKVDLTVTNAKG